MKSADTREKDVVDRHSEYCEPLGLETQEESPVIWLNQLLLMFCGLVFMQQSTPHYNPWGISLLLDGGFISWLLRLVEGEGGRKQKL